MVNLDMNPLDHTYEEIMLALMQEPMESERLFNNMRVWNIDDGMKDEMLKHVKTTIAYKSLAAQVELGRTLAGQKIKSISMPNMTDEQLENIALNGVWQNAIIAVKCHALHVKEHQHMTDGYDVRWTLVIHEEDVGTFFDSTTGKGTIIDMKKNSYLTFLGGCITCDESLVEVPHSTIYGISQNIPLLNQLG